MIDYFISLFTKPMYLWTFFDSLAVFGLFVGLFIIFLGIYITTTSICKAKRKKKFRDCDNKMCNSASPANCLNCKEYKKKVEK